MNWVMSKFFTVCHSIVGVSATSRLLVIAIWTASYSLWGLLLKCFNFKLPKVMKQKLHREVVDDVQMFALKRFCLVKCLDQTANHKCLQVSVDKSFGVGVTCTQYSEGIIYTLPVDVKNLGGNIVNTFLDWFAAVWNKFYTLKFRPLQLMIVFTYNYTCYQNGLEYFW